MASSETVRTSFKKRFKLMTAHYLNNRYLEAGTIITWPADQKSQHMVEVNAQGVPVSPPKPKIVEDVTVLDIKPKEPAPEEVELSETAREDKIALAVSDILQEQDSDEFTKDGQIKIEAVRRRSEIVDVTRDEIALAEQELAAAEAEEEKSKKAGDDAALAATDDDSVVVEEGGE